MNLPAAILVIRWLIWDTIRQSLASRIFWIMLLVSLIATVFCLSISVSELPTKPTGDAAERLPPTDPQGKKKDEARRAGVDVIDASMTLLFGTIQVPQVRYREDAVRWLQLVLAAGVADTLGILLALIWTAAFLPTFFEPTAVTVLLAKPIPRWSLLAGKYLGVLVFVALQASIFVFATWAALGIRSGIWSAEYLWCIPLMLLHFAIFFSFSAFLAVWTRSTIVCVFGSLLFWMVCWGINFGRHSALAHVERQRRDSPDQAVVYSRTLEGAYWLLPKPADLGYLLAKSLNSEREFPLAEEIKTVEEADGLNPEASLIASLLFALAMLGVAGYEFVKAEY